MTADDETAEARRWTPRYPFTRRLLRALKQPMTVTQLSGRAGIPRETCSRLLAAAIQKDLVRCLTPDERRARVYALTPRGRACREFLSPTEELPQPIIDVDWELYSWICYRQRAAVLLALDEPLQPAAIARKARRNDATLRMSANNTRDVIYDFTAKGIVRAHQQKGYAHRRYVLTPLGRRLQALLLTAGTPAP